MKPAAIDPPEIDATLWKDIGGQVGWDIGANCGQTLPQMTSRFAEVHAFEPAAECQPWLRPWTVDAATRRGTVRVWPVAVSDTDQPIELYAVPDKIDTGQLVTPTDGMEWSRRLWEAEHQRQVPATTVDTMTEKIGPPDFLKIDVEGHETRVLTGARQTLTDFMPRLLIEFHSPELYRRCRECLIHHGYRGVEVIRHPHYPPDGPMWHQHGWIRAHHW